MKRLHALLFLLVIGGMMFTSCNNNDDDDPKPNTNESPVLTLSNPPTAPGADYTVVTGDVTLSTDNLKDSLYFFVNATKNTTTNTDLGYLQVLLSIQGGGVTDQEISRLPETGNLTNPERNGFSDGYTRATPSAPGVYTYTFRLYDRNNRLAQVSVRVTVVEPSVCANTNITGTVNYANGTVTVSGVSGGTAPYSYDFYFDSTEEPDFGSTATFVPQQNGALKVDIKDANGCVSTLQTTISGTALAASTEKILGAQNATAGSMYEASTGVVSSITAYATTKSTIDLIHYFGAVNNATIASPDDADMATVFAVSTTGAQDVNFLKLSSTGLYASAGLSEGLIATYNAGTPSSAATQLAVGNEVIFKVGDRYGILKETAVPTANTGTLTFDVKF